MVSFYLLCGYAVCGELFIYCSVPPCSYSLFIEVSRFRMVALDFGVGRGLVYSVLDLWLTCLLGRVSTVVYLFSLAISPSRFGRPGDWPVSLWGQGELACTGLQNRCAESSLYSDLQWGSRWQWPVCQRGVLVCVCTLSISISVILVIYLFPLAISPLRLASQVTGLFPYGGQGRVGWPHARLQKGHDCILL